MEQIRRAAVAYYEHLPARNKKLARKTFKAMDKNGDGKISLLEYVNYLKKNKATDFIHPSIFTALDKDGNGSLDFKEAIVLYYIMKSGRAIICKGCDSFLAGAYFSCSQCFFNDDSDSTYEICCACYGGKNYTHHGDAIFCDNYTLLRQSRSVIQEAPIKNRRKVLKSHKKTLLVAEITVGLAGITVGAAELASKCNCSIM
ncbi:hypothetical protein NC651_039680 [Populus alba x Populus x berolinensis]|uniref:EF-hand domain-containing protein n=1 Tax=Populus davidiana TaxID=266767 RepID=A0A6M2EN10_9ROSI|nr:hypothetical protein NC651_039680 [Populus alba x Populus x berolinensis]